MSVSYKLNSRKEKLKFDDEQTNQKYFLEALSQMNNTIMEREDGDEDLVELGTFVKDNS